MNVNDMARNWTRWGDKDPMWAIVTHPGKDANRWNADEFYATGELTVRQTMSALASQGITFRSGLALDFGCGIGRLSRALASHFSHVHGVDISPSMIRRAREQAPAIDAISYFVNPRADLSLLDEFRYDFIYSREVLQHIPTTYQCTYIREFLRLLAPQGLAVFQTIATVRWRRWLPNTLVDCYRRLKHGDKEFMPIYGIRSSVVMHLSTQHGGRIVSYSGIPHPTHPTRFRYDTYCIRKSS